MIKVPRKENGNIDWKLLLVGPSWKKFITDRIIFLILIGLIFAYQYDTGNCRDAYNDPCKYCERIDVPFSYVNNTPSGISLDYEVQDIILHEQTQETNQTNST